MPTGDPRACRGSATVTRGAAGVRADQEPVLFATRRGASTPIISGRRVRVASVSGAGSARVTDVFLGRGSPHVTYGSPTDGGNSSRLRCQLEPDPDPRGRTWLTDLEKMLKRPGFKIYRYLAEEAISWRLPLNLPSPPNPAKLMAVMKDLWVRVLYGGHLREIVRDHFDVLVPGTFPKKFTKRYNAAIETAEGDLRAFLESILWYGKPGEGKLSDFLRASEEVARVAMARDRMPASASSTLSPRP